MIQKIPNCYDSHTHFWATGQVASGLKLNALTSAEDIKKIKIEKTHYRDRWITGFGWNQNNWPGGLFPDKKILDEVFGETPVFFSRVDGHASWINSAAIVEFKKLGLDFSGLGLLQEQAHINALMKLPAFSAEQDLSFFEKSQKIFNQAGFTHVRDLSMHEGSWHLLKKMEDAKRLTVCIDAFVTAENLNDLDRVLKEIGRMRESGSEQMRLLGVKIFIDGSLGSQTAYISKPYQRSKNTGVLHWPEDEIKHLLRKSWMVREQVAIHCIGDEAVHTAVKAARDVAAEGVLGRLHLEHVQILRGETLQMMKPLHVTCHLQPCHWLSDHSWLKEALPEELVQNLFQWELLRKNRIPFFFGSDSPIEPASLAANHRALLQSAEWGVRALDEDWKKYHSHPDAQWCSSFTEINADDVVQQVNFRGQTLL